MLIVLILFSYQMNVLKKAKTKLLDDCDPNPYFRYVQDKLKTADTRSFAYSVYQMDLASIMLIKGEYHAGYELLQSIDSNKLKKQVIRLCYLNDLLFAQCLIGEMEEAQITKMKLEKQFEDFKFPMRKQYEQIRISVRNSIATYELMCGNLEISKQTYMEDLHSEYSNQYTRTIIHYYLGQICEQEQQINQALEHYEASYPKAKHYYFYNDLIERISKLKMSIQEQSGSL